MDSAALRRQLEACHEESFAWALNCCRRDRGDAEEVLQTAYLKVLDGRARFDGRSQFRTWLFAVIRRTAAEWRRTAVLRRLRLMPVGQAMPAVAAPPPPDHTLHDAERRAALEGALAALSERQRQVLLLVFYHGCTVDEAARVMGIGIGSARTHYARGKARLRALLEAGGWSDERRRP